AKIQKIRIARQVPCQYFNLTFEFQGLFDPIRQMHQVGEEFLRLRLAQASPPPAQRDSQEVERRQLSRKSFGACHADLGSRVSVETSIGLSGNRRVNHVADGYHFGFLEPRYFNRRQSVRRFTGLTDHEQNRARVHQRGAISELRTVVDFRRDLRDFFDHEFAHQAGMPRSPTSDEMNALDLARLACQETNVFQCTLAIFQREATAKRTRHGARLIMNLFKHEMAIAPFASRYRVPSDFFERSLNRLSFAIKKAK